MRILAVDYGLKRVGVAISDPLGISAQGLESIPHESVKHVIEKIFRIITDYQIGEVVVGLPVHMNGSVGKEAEAVMAFCDQLKTSCGVEIKTLDERLTSRQAERLMIEQGLSREKRKQKSDQLAAMMILQNYLEMKR